MTAGMVISAVPASADISAQKTGAEVGDGDVFESNAELDKHVIFQAFGLFQPDDYNTYTTLTENADLLAEWGITDLWAPPPYRVAGDSKYREGYAIADRYDLGAYGKGPTKYGTADELKGAIDAMHDEGLRVQVDVVPNQMIGLTQRRVLPVTPVDPFGNPIGEQFVYATYTKGTAPGQTEHGVIKEWDYQYYHGTSSQYQGLYRVLVDDEGEYIRYFGPDDPQNNLPAWLAETEAAQYGKINVVDGYLLADSYYAVEGAATETTDDDKYAPVLLYYVDPRPGSMEQTYLDYARENGYTGTDDEVRAQLLALPPAEIGPFTDAYLLEQPGYNRETEPGATAYRFDGELSSPEDIGENVLQYEFLIGNDLNTQRADVRAEQANWQQYLLDFGFDGFRIDAASHVDTRILVDEKEQRLANFPNDDVNEHLSYIESYTTAQVPFEESNQFGQLVMDNGPYLSYLGAFGRKNQAVNNVFEGSVNDRVNGYAPEDAVPNWSFINNHDQEFNVISPIPLTPEEAGDLEPNTFAYEKVQFEKYDADRKQQVKQYAPYNVPVSYAIALTNKDTVPTVFYGDMFKTTGAYFKEKTPYYEEIVKLLEIRKQYASGEQDVILQPTHSSSELGGDLVSSARLGTSRDTGVAIVAGNFPGANDTIEVEMGAQHANQVFHDAMGLDDDVVVSDADGTLTISVEGMRTVEVDGYLSAYVPVEDAAVLENVKAPKIKANLNKLTLTTDGGTWATPNPELTYQWLRNGEPIEGATDADYRPRRADLGKTISVQVTADDDTHAPGTATSKGLTLKLPKWSDIRP
ncbi:glycoside hydrolase family 70 protein [Micromonospora sp. DT81.3]|uniref:glycoside hydrolase family 70 protein n=1 Tax=Micromonospora sp. DT81.3 TaxID=3416523 RepID=UPI003CEF82FD